jgi:hypothetical protein
LRNRVIFSIVLSLFFFSAISVYAQQPQLATYRETAQILVDHKFQNLTTAFITLSTTSPLEMRVPPELDKKIHDAKVVSSVTITNTNSCIERVGNKGCVLINIVNPSLIETYNITKIQSESQKIGDALIGDINKDFGLSAEFYAVFVNPKGELSNSLGTSGAVAGNRTISVVYTMSQLKSSYLYDSLTAILLPKQIMDSGGFFDVAKKMKNNPNSDVTFAITPKENISYYQLQVGNRFPIKNQTTTINAIDLFGIDRLDRSSYFNAGFFPLNSILQVTLLSNQPMSIIGHGGDLVPITEGGGQKIPADFTKAGWLFDPSSGNQITAIYLFGTTFSASKNDLTLTIGNTTAGVENPIQPTSPPPPKPVTADYSLYTIIGILAAAGVAIYIFLRKR